MTSARPLDLAPGASGPRYFFHSFPRKRHDEAEDVHQARALRILEAMGRIGLVLAPEVVRWELGPAGSDGEVIDLLQRRVSFTELAVDELPSHSEVFGPISLQFRIPTLRSAGALPVSYIPQGFDDIVASFIPALLVKNAWNTLKVLQQLEGLRSQTDPNPSSNCWKKPILPSARLTLSNQHPDGNIENQHEMAMSDAHAVIRYVLYRNIPFSYAAGSLQSLLTMFYPADNSFSDEELGYYRQREWRIFGDSIAEIENHALTRPLTQAEVSELQAIDPIFWAKHIEHTDSSGTRATLARAFAAAPGWNPLDHVECIVVPPSMKERAQKLVGERTSVHVLS